MQLFAEASKKKVKRAGRGDRTLDLPLTKRLPCHLAIPAVYAMLEGAYQKRLDLIFRARIELATFCV
jgi:hypothetical protein